MGGQAVFENWLNRNKIATEKSNGHYRNGNKHLIQLQEVVKTFETAAGSFTALKGVDLRVDAVELPSQPLIANSNPS